MSELGGVPLSAVGVEQAGGRWRYAFPMLFALLLAPGALMAQRVVEGHDFEEPEGRLLGFYAAAVAFSPAGFGASDGALTLGLELTYIPWLDASQRRASIDKPEATNLAPVFPRPRLGVRLPGDFTLEASWIPPLQLFDVEANLVGLAVSRPLAQLAGVTIAPRVWATAGRVRGAMTCNEDTMLGHGTELETYYATVCRGHESDDWFEPRLLGGEVMATRPLLGGTVQAYASVGARYDRTKFDIGVYMPNGGRDPDHPILEIDTVRPHGSFGAAWHAGRRWWLGAEGYYAPGSLFTARVMARWTVRP
ncbi:MAG TPA: hypothetical protein VF178_01110 [Gemmatimonadaceae bacterium]